MKHCPSSVSQVRTGPSPVHFSEKYEIPGYNFVHNMKTVYRDETERVKSADKSAILKLAASVDKKKLGKRQQILFDMKQRCRTQEITDLSRRISSRCSTVAPNTTMNPAMYATNSVYKNHHLTTMDNSGSNLDPGAGFGVRFITGIDKNETSFPLRRSLRKSQKHLQFQPLPMVKVGYVTENTPRTSKDNAPKEDDQLDMVEQGQKHKSHFAPLLLPEIRQIHPEQNQNGPYFSTSRLNFVSRVTHQQEEPFLKQGRTPRTM